MAKKPNALLEKLAELQRLSRMELASRVIERDEEIARLRAEAARLCAELELSDNQTAERDEFTAELRDKCLRLELEARRTGPLVAGLVLAVRAATGDLDPPIVVGGE